MHVKIKASISTFCSSDAHYNLCVYTIYSHAIVTPTVTIIKQPNNVTVCSGGEAVFSCVISGPYIASNIITAADWQIMTKKFGFVSVLKRDRHILYQKVKYDTLIERLIITNVSKADSGSLYRCMVTESVVSRTVTILLAGNVQYLSIQ